MQFHYERIDAKQFTLYPIGDWHLGSLQSNQKFIKQVIQEIADNPRAKWVGMGDFMENAIIGSKSDVYTQTISPEDQAKQIAEWLKPIKHKGLFMIGGNHERRSHRVTGMTPEEYISAEIGRKPTGERWVPYMGFSCVAVFQLMKSKNPNTFFCYFHHNYGGGYTPGGKVNKAQQPRKICPTADATFSGHFHITSRIPVTWYTPARKKILKHTGYDYITGSALEWDNSYAEEKCKPPATMEFINVTFVGNSTGDERYYDNRKQIYKIITPRK